MIIGKKFYSLTSAISKVGLNKWVNYKNNLINDKEIIIIHRTIFHSYCKIFVIKKQLKKNIF